MPKLGFNLLNWTASISDDFFPHIERLKKIGYDGIEICMGQQDPAAYKRLKKLLEAPPPEETDSLIEEKTDSVSESESESESEESESETESEESASESESEESDSDYEPDEEDNSRQDRMQACSHCKELGHKITKCPLRWNTVIRNLRCNQEVLRDYVLESE